MSGIGYVESYKVASKEIMKKTYARNRFCLTKCLPRICYVDHRRPNVDLFCLSIKTLCFLDIKNPKLNNGLLLCSINFDVIN